MFAEFFGKEEGYCRGRGGSMHIADVESGNLGANGIVAGGIPIAVGAALAIKKQKRDDVALCFFGDGATNEGAFHEALNMASIWKLPVIFVCENNKYGMSVSTERSMAVDQCGRPRRRLQHAGRHRRRQPHRGCGRSGYGRHCAGPRRRGADADRMQDLSHPRPFQERPQPLPHQGRDRGMEGCAIPIGHFEAELVANGIATADEVAAIRAAAEAEIAAGIEFAQQRHRPFVRVKARVSLYPRNAGMNAPIRELTYAQAIQEALAQAMEADERVFLMGEDIGVYGGAFQVTGDLVHRFGEDRVMDTPIAELGAAGVAVGAALAGSRPVFEFQFSDFATLAMEQIVNQAAKIRFMLGGKVSVPLVMRFPAGSGTGAAAQHSQSLEAWLAHVPGLKVVQPSTPHDAKGLLLAAIDDPDPVMVFEHKLLYKMKGEVPEEAYRVPIGKAVVRREGRHVTIVATSIMVHRALEAAEVLAGEGIEAEVIDLRTLRPLDTATIIESVKKTTRLACVYEGVKTLGIGAEISAMIAESEAFDYLDAPILRLGGVDSPIPYNPLLEKAAVPQTPGIIEQVRNLVKGRI